MLLFTFVNIVNVYSWYCQTSRCIFLPQNRTKICAMRKKIRENIWGYVTTTMVGTRLTKVRHLLPNRSEKTRGCFRGCTVVSNRCWTSQRPLLYTNQPQDYIGYIVLASTLHCMQVKDPVNRLVKGRLQDMRTSDGYATFIRRIFSLPEKEVWH